MTAGQAGVFPREFRQMAERIRYENGRWMVPDRPIIPFIEGDGTGPDISRAARRVFDASVARASGGKRQLDCVESLAGGTLLMRTGHCVADATLHTLQTPRAAIQ